MQALSHEPELLILDEPTIWLDPLMQNEFYELLRAEKQKVSTICYCSHVLRDVQKICDRVRIIRERLMLKIEKIENLRKDIYLEIKVESKF